MKSTLRSILVIGCLLAATAPLLAQTPTPSPSPSATPAPAPPGPIYNDTTQSVAARLADAQAYLPTLTDPAQIEAVTYNIDYWLLLSAQQWSDVQALAESLIASHGAYYSGPATPNDTQDHRDNMFAWGVEKKAQFAFTKNDDRIAFVAASIHGLPGSATPYLVTRLDDVYGYWVRAKTQDLIASGDYAGALANALQPLLLNDPARCAGTIQDVLRIKTITHASDLLPWAKAVYVMGAFGASGQTSVLVANAFRATSGLGAANAFIASQTDDTVPSPLASVAFPDALTSGPLPEPQYAGINLLLRGDPKGALAYARAQYDVAATNDELNARGDDVAAAIRNVHFNLVRANQFVLSNQPPAAGQPTPAPFVFTELQ